RTNISRCSRRCTDCGIRPSPSTVSSKRYVIGSIGPRAMPFLTDSHTSPRQGGTLPANSPSNNPSAASWTIAAKQTPCEPGTAARPLRLAPRGHAEPPPARPAQLTAEAAEAGEHAARRHLQVGPVVAVEEAGPAGVEAARVGMAQVQRQGLPLPHQLQRAV